MITDKKNGVKIAESEEEKLWYSIVEARKMSIKNAKQTIEVEQLFLLTATKKLKEVQRGLKK